MFRQLRFFCRDLICHPRLIALISLSEHADDARQPGCLVVQRFGRASGFLDQGQTAIEQVCLDMLEGRSKPDEGNVLSVFE